MIRYLFVAENLDRAKTFAEAYKYPIEQCCYVSSTDIKDVYRAAGMQIRPQDLFYVDLPTSEIHQYLKSTLRLNFDYYEDSNG